jgi:hypothetical protein
VNPQTLPRQNDPSATPPVTEFVPLVVPSGWEPIAELCERVTARADVIVISIVARIREEIPAYQPHAPVSDPDLQASVAGNLKMMLRGTTERRGPWPEELERACELGIRRADQGFPVSSLLQAFVLGYRELWNQLVLESQHERPEVREKHLSGAATVWEWVHEITDAVGTAYHERIRKTSALASAMRERLFEALLAGSTDEDEIRAIATSLGFDADRDFRALAAAHTSTDPGLPDHITNQLRPAKGRQEAVQRGDVILLLDQHGAPEQLVAILQATIGQPAIGIGTSRTGLPGAGLSIGDAQRALAVALRTGGVVDFDHGWHAATIIAAEHRLVELLRPGIEQARTSPDLALTIRAFADSGFSMSKAARVLNVHTNTVTYRLARWAELTSWDPRTHDGLLRSISALDLAGRSKLRTPG